ncbi:AAA family ATPase [Halobacteriovorax sp.]|uniref:ATP-binding protein n=1 Tax=Halobacteriovorax sp. TaxID=2020862 RepID=UPI003AF23000
MSSLSSIINAFQRTVEENAAEIIKIEKSDYFDSIYISGAKAHSKSKTLVSQVFGGRKTRIIDIVDKDCIRVDISKVDLEDKIIEHKDYLKYLDDNKDKGWFLGLSDFGPIHYSFENFTHAYITGATGYGKSTFFKHLMTQTLNTLDDVSNFIVDPKRVDYKHMQQHKNVGFYADTKDRWNELFTYLLIELKAREYYFNKSFTTPPVKIDEYKRERKKHNRNDLPDFKRFFIWIDEAHEVIDMKSYSPQQDTLRNIIEYIARKGRAFGIHLILSTQRQNDIISAVRNQCQTHFVFYQNNYSSLESDLLTSENRGPLTKRVGQLHFLDDKLERKEVLTPYLSQDECIIISAGNKQKIKSNSDNISYFKKFSIHNSFFKNNKNLERLYSGDDLESLHVAPQNNRSQNVFSTFKNNIHNVRTTNKRTEKDKQDSSKKRPDNLLSEFEKMLGEEKSQNKNPEKNVAMLDDEGNHKVFEVSQIMSTNNNFNFDNIEKAYKDLYRNSKNNFLGFCKSIEHNHNYKKVIEFLKLNSIENTNIINLNNLALSEKDKKLSKRFIEETKTCIQLGNRAPMLIISGSQGMGRTTIAKSIMNEINIRVISDKEADRSQNDDQNTIAILFTSQERALQHYRNNQKGLTLLIQGYERSEGLFSTPYLPDFKYLKDYHFNLVIEESDYAEEKTYTKLITAILRKHNYISDIDTKTISILSSANIRTTPQKLDAIISHAQQKSIQLDVKFDYDILEQTIEDYKDKLAQESIGQIEITKPSLGLKDIMIEGNNNELLLDIISRSKNLGKFKYQFAKKIRQNSKVVALFAGPPGTGKSMSAEVIASETNKDLWKLDFGKLQSKYVGETEKTLSRVFKLASHGNAVLLLDECDTFLMNRQEANEFNKKIANHLLNLIENFNGILILTTNSPTAIDPAFSRRIDIKCFYQLPSTNLLAAMLDQLLSPDAPLSDNFSSKKVLDGINISGGVLRSAVERIIAKMERLGLKEITNELARKCILEAFDEDKIINSSRQGQISLIKNPA